MPRLNEGKCFDDEKKLEKFIIDVYKTSRTMQNSTVFLDTFVDNDRGYYPRIGLLDRRLNPRKAFHALKSVSQQLSQQIWWILSIYSFQIAINWRETKWTEDRYFSKFICYVTNYCVIINQWIWLFCRMESFWVRNELCWKFCFK